MIEYENIVPGTAEIIYFVPEKDGITVCALIGGKIERVKWDREVALRKLADLAQFITEIEDAPD